MVTAAAVLLIVAGALGVLGGLLLLAGAGVAAGAGVGGLFLVIAILILGVGAVEIYAGIQVLGLHERGRMIGIVVAAVGAFFNLISIGRAPGTSVIGILIDAFIIYALVTNAKEFHA
jgi:hypothetical protein